MSEPALKKNCGAKSRRNAGAPCRNMPVTGMERCRMHGGITKVKGKPNAARLTHGESSDFVRKSVVRELLKGASPFSNEAVRKKLIELNLLDRRVRRKEIGAEVDLDVQLRLDEADRRDVETLIKADALEQQAENAGLVQIIAPQATAIVVTPVRGPEGLTELVSLPDGRQLLRDGKIWCDARRTTTEEGAELWVPEERATEVRHGE